VPVKSNYTKNGNEYYRVTATIGRDSNGKPIRKEFYGKGKKDAESKRDEYLNGIKNGLNLDFNNTSLGRLIYVWLFEVARIKSKPSTFERYEGIYRNYIKDTEIYALLLNDLKSIHLQRHYNSLHESGKTTSQIKNLNKLLKSFFNYAVDEGYILKNPCSGKKIVIPGDNEFDPNENEDEDVVVFADEEINLIKKALENNRIQALVLLNLGTGLRQGELLALKWSDLSEGYKNLKVQRSIKHVKVIAADETSEYKTLVQTPKTKCSLRTVPIPSSLIPILEKHRAMQHQDKEKAGSSYTDSYFIFTTESGNNIDTRNLRRAYERMLKKAGVEFKKFHALRHTYATKLFEKGVPLKTVQKLLGHSDISITANIYTHVMPEQKIDAAEELNDLFS
jgi:integrase